jgi:hypothetical protein
MSDYVRNLQIRKLRAEITKLEAESRKIELEASWFHIGLIAIVAIAISSVIRLFV